MNDHAMHHMVDGESSPKEYAKFAMVIAGIIVLSWLLTALYGPHTLAGSLRWFMGVFFLVFAGFKFAGYRMFAMMFAGYDILAKRFKGYAYAYPFIEISLGIAYLFDRYPAPRDALTLVVMAVSSVGVVQEIQKRRGIHCACLGDVIKLPLST